MSIPNGRARRLAGMQVAVVGAGLAGLVAAQGLCRSGVRVTVFERADHVGGLIRSVPTVAGHADVAGAHYLPLGDPVARRWAASILEPAGWTVTRPAIRFLVQGRLIARVPLRMVPAALRASGRRGPPPTRLVDRLTWMYGRPLTEELLRPWAARLFDDDLEELESVEGPPLPGAPPLGPITARWVRANAGMLFDARASQPMAYPRRGGMQAFADGHLRGVERVVTGTDVTRLRRHDAGWMVDDHGPFDHVVSSMPPAALVGALPTVPDDIRTRAERLEAVPLTVGYFVRDRVRMPRHVHRMWYVVDDAGPFNRVVFRATGSGTEEVMADAAGRLSADETRRAGAALRLGRLLEVFHTDAAFPLPRRGGRADADAVTAWATTQGIVQIGRWTWQPSSMVTAVHHGLAAAERLLRHHDQGQRSTGDG